MQLPRKNWTTQVEFDCYLYKATKQLGMVAASEKQMDTYESRKSTQVRTHGDIPAE